MSEKKSPGSFYVGHTTGDQLTTLKQSYIYITSTEATPTLKPRKCKIIRVLWSNERQQNFYLKRLDNPIKLDFSKEITELVIAPRHVRVKIIEEINSHPLIFICFIENYQNIQKGLIEAKDLRLFIIGEIYQSETEAEKAIQSEKNRI
jgi:hypothetical protein